MKKSLVIKRGLIFGLLTLFTMNLVSCSAFIETNFSDEKYQNGEAQNDFYTKLKVKRKRNKIQDVEVFYGNTEGLDYAANEKYFSNEFNAQVLEKDESQILKYKLVKMVYASEYDSRSSLLLKSEDIYVMRNTLGYFYSEAFRLPNHSITDSIDINDLAENYDKYGAIKYSFSLTPIEDETIKRFIDGQPVYLDGIICSYYSRIYYKIDMFDRIVFKILKDNGETVIF